MEVEITLRGSLKRRLGDKPQPFMLDLPEGSDVGVLVEELRRRSYMPERRAHVASVNGKREKADRVLHQGDEVHFFPIVSGG